MDVFGCQGPPTRFEWIVLAVARCMMLLCWAAVPLLLFVPYS